MTIFGVPLQALMSQLLLGLVNGSFYAMLSLGLAVIFGLLNVINFSHGALYMVGAFLAYIGVTQFGLNYWMMLVLAPLLVGLLGIVIERTMLRWLYKFDHLYGLLLTFGLTLLVEAFGVNVPMMVMLTYGFGVALAGLAGVLAAPVINVTPLMGSNLIIVVFAVVVIGGMGSILGSILTGLGLGVIEGLTRVFYPEASNVVVFVVMVIVLILRPAGLFGKEA